MALFGVVRGFSVIAAAAGFTLALTLGCGAGAQDPWEAESPVDISHGSKGPTAEPVQGSGTSARSMSTSQPADGGKFVPDELPLIVFVNRQALDRTLLGSRLTHWTNQLLELRVRSDNGNTKAAVEEWERRLFNLSDWFWLGGGKQQNMIVGRADKRAIEADPALRPIAKALNWVRPDLYAVRVTVQAQGDLLSPDVSPPARGVQLDVDQVAFAVIRNGSTLVGSDFEGRLELTGTTEHKLAIQARTPLAPGDDPETVVAEMENALAAIKRTGALQVLRLSALLDHTRVELEDRSVVVSISLSDADTQNLITDTDATIAEILAQGSIEAYLRKVGERAGANSVFWMPEPEPRSAATARSYSFGRSREPSRPKSSGEVLRENWEREDCERVAGKLKNERDRADHLRWCAEGKLRQR